MSIDLIARAPNKATLHTFAETYGLRIPDGEGGFRNHPGFRWTWWADSGKFMIAQGDPPTFASGRVAILRITNKFFVNGQEDTLIPSETDPDKGEQWARSRVARFIRNNGTQGTSGGISYWQLDNVRLYKPADVNAFLLANNVPGHGWQGGNRT